MGLTLGDDHVDVPFVCGHQGLLDGVAAYEDLGFVVASGIELLDFLDVLAEIVSEREPDGNWLLGEDSLNTWILRRLSHVADPAKETDADWDRRLSGKVQCLANGAKTLLDFVGGIEACDGCEIATVPKSGVHVPAPMKPKPPAPVTAAASSGVEANAIGAATIGLLMSAIGSVSIDETTNEWPYSRVG